VPERRDGTRCDKIADAQAISAIEVCREEERPQACLTIPYAGPPLFNGENLDLVVTHQNYVVHSFSDRP
jgi:hypothetical protein